MSVIMCVPQHVVSLNTSSKYDHEVQIKVKKKSKVVPIYAMRLCRGNGCMAALILNLGTRWRWVVGQTPRPLHSWGARHTH